MSEPETVLCGWCKKPNDIGDWCSAVCFENWHRERAEEAPLFSTGTVFHTGPLKPVTVSWLNHLALGYRSWC